MPVQGDESIRSRVTTLSAILLATGFAALGLLMLFFSGVQPVKENLQWSAFLSQLGGLLVATGLITIAWDLFGRRAFAAEVLAKARVSTDIAASGIERVTDQYLDEVQWRDLFDGVNRLDIIVAYASTWRNAQRRNLEEAARRPGGRIRIVLPDPRDESTVTVLADRFSMTTDVLRQRIYEAIDDFRSFSRSGGAEVDVRVRRGDLVFSCYRFDSRAVVTLYSHARMRRTSVPTFVAAEGSLFRFLYEEIKAIIEQSEPAPEVPL